jgi:hypothetical protein
MWKNRLYAVRPYVKDNLILRRKMSFVRRAIYDKDTEKY